MEYLGVNFPVLKDWGRFEDLCCDLWSQIYSCRFIRNGREGQCQQGVDYYALTVDGYIGLQCKLRLKSDVKPLSKAEVLREVKKAQQFTPKLHKLIFATSSPHDQALQEYARDISEKYQLKGLFSVEVYGWEFINDFLNRSRRLFIILCQRHRAHSAM